MSWQRAARMLVAGIGLATAVAIVLFMRERPAPVQRGVAPPLEPGAALQSGSGVDVRYRGGDRQASIEFDERIGCKDGRIGWKYGRISLRDGSLLSAGLIESVGEATTPNSPGAEMRLRDGVRLDTGAGATLAGESATHNDTTGETSIPGAVTFSRGRVAGRGTGGVYERDTDTFRVLADVVVTLEAAPPGGRIEATAATMTFTTATRSMLFDGNARITRATEVLSADRAVLFLSDDDEHFRAIELRGRARVDPAAGSGDALPAMAAADIDLAFHEGTQALRAATLNGQATLTQRGVEGDQTIEAPHIDLETARDGRTLTNLRGGPTGVTVRLAAANGAPARTIESATLAATGTEQSGLLNAVFMDAVRFTEQVAAAAGRQASTRVGRSRWLGLDLDGKLNAVKSATFRQDVTFTATSQGTTMTGDADIGVYDAAAGQLVLTPSALKASRLPQVSDGDVRVEASERIVVDLETNSLEAHENVKTLSSDKSKSGARGFFTPGQPVRGSSAAFTRDQATRTLRYTGSASAPAWLQQGEDSRIEAHAIALNEETGDLSATGQVRSDVRLEAAPVGRGSSAGPDGRGSSAAPARYRITAETMQYVEKPRTATYGGAPAVLQRLDGEKFEIRAKALALTLASDERRLERLEAAGEMRATLDGGREAVGDQLTHRTAADRYTVRGRPVLVRFRQDDGTCSLSRGQLVHFVGGDRGHEWPLSDNPGGTASGAYSCTEPLR